jgi:hypothetical protein
MRCLLLSSLVLTLGLGSCARIYSKLPAATVVGDCPQQLKPSFGVVKYKAAIDVTGRHLSGILVCKTMDDGEKRVVFLNEFGSTFFDFGYKGETFTVYQVLEQLNKKAVIKTLRKDFMMLLWEGLDWSRMQHVQQNEELLHRIPISKGDIYIVTDAACKQVLRVENTGKNKVAILHPFGGSGTLTDSVHISHTKFSFEIALKKMNND